MVFFKFSAGAVLDTLLEGSVAADTKLAYVSKVRPEAVRRPGVAPRDTLQFAIMRRGGHKRHFTYRAKQGEDLEDVRTRLLPLLRPDDDSNDDSHDACDLDREDATFTMTESPASPAGIVHEKDEPPETNEHETPASTSDADATHVTLSSLLSLSCQDLPSSERDSERASPPKTTDERGSDSDNTIDSCMAIDVNEANGEAFVVSGHAHATSEAASALQQAADATMPQEESIDVRWHGVHWYKASNKWRAEIKMGIGTKKHLGYFKDDVTAALAYDAAARNLLQDPVLNFPDEVEASKQRDDVVQPSPHRKVEGYHCMAICLDGNDVQPCPITGGTGDSVDARGNDAPQQAASTSPCVGVDQDTPMPRLQQPHVHSLPQRESLSRSHHQPLRQAVSASPPRDPHSTSVQPLLQAPSPTLKEPRSHALDHDPQQRQQQDSQAQDSHQSTPTASSRHQAQPPGPHPLSMAKPAGEAQVLAAQHTLQAARQLLYGSSPEASDADGDEDLVSAMCSKRKRREQQAGPSSGQAATKRYRGVSFYKPNGKWRAMLSKKGTTKHFGFYDTAHEAAAAVDRALRRLGKGSGDYNFPDGPPDFSSLRSHEGEPRKVEPSDAGKAQDDSDVEEKNEETKVGRQSMSEQGHHRHEHHHRQQPCACAGEREMAEDEETEHRHARRDEAPRCNRAHAPSTPPPGSSTPPSTSNSSNKSPKSRYRGVSWCAQSSRWIAVVYFKGIRTHLGGFTSEQDAARAWDRAARERNKEPELIKFHTGAEVEHAELRGDTIIDSDDADSEDDSCGDGGDGEEEEEGDVQMNEGEEEEEEGDMDEGDDDEEEEEGCDVQMEGGEADVEHDEQQQQQQGEEEEEGSVEEESEIINFLTTAEGEQMKLCGEMIIDSDDATSSDKSGDDEEGEEGSDVDMDEGEEEEEEEGDGDEGDEEEEEEEEGEQEAGVLLEEESDKKVEVERESEQEGQGAEGGVRVSREGHTDVEVRMQEDNRPGVVSREMRVVSSTARHAHDPSQSGMQPPSQRRRGGTSIYRGVSWQRQVKRWRVQLQVAGKNRHLGNFDNEEDAARAYDRAARQYCTHPRLNFPEDAASDERPSRSSSAPRAASSHGGRGHAGDDVSDDACSVNGDSKKAAVHPRDGGSSKVCSKGHVSRFRGVSWRNGCWTARIQHDNRQVGLGQFNDEIEAALAYDEAARLYHERPLLNFSDGQEASFVSGSVALEWDSTSDEECAEVDVCTESHSHTYTPTETHPQMDTNAHTEPPPATEHLCTDLSPSAAVSHVRHPQPCDPLVTILRSSVMSAWVKAAPHRRAFYARAAHLLRKSQRDRGLEAAVTHFARTAVNNSFDPLNMKRRDHRERLSDRFIVCVVAGHFDAWFV